MDVDKRFSQWPGRIIEHDPRSRSFPVETDSVVVKTKTWRRYGAVLDQGHLGSCTGNAAAQSLNHLPLRTKGKIRTEDDAVRLYSRATHLDAWPETYPPDDSGSSGLAVCKAMREEGLITRWETAFGLDHALAALMRGPLLIGTWWYTGMHNPDINGFVHKTGFQSGGHEYVLFGANVEKKYLTFLNSWSNIWGINGRFHMTFDTFKELLDQDGDAILPIK